jgi:hypothetical protein
MLRCPQLQMTIEIHALMQNTNDLNPGRSLTKKDHVSTHAIFPIARTNIVAWASSTWITFDDCKCAIEFPDVGVRLILVPAVSRVGPDFCQICASASRKNVGAHSAEARFRISSRNSSTSKGVASPLCSPSIRAARSASSFVSCSSSNRSAAETTSLAEPYRPCATRSSIKVAK